MQFKVLHIPSCWPVIEHIINFAYRVLKTNAIYVVVLPITGGR